MKPISSVVNQEIYHRRTNFTYKSNWQRLHVDPPLLFGIILLTLYGLAILYSATNQSAGMMVKQGLRLSLAYTALFIFAQIPPDKYRNWSLPLYVSGCVLLITVLIIGKIGKGAQRWLDLGIIRFQPSEIMKIALPMTIAWFFSEKPLPPRPLHLFFAALLILIPGALTAKQPDLGTALMIMFAGGCVILFAGISWRFIVGVATLLAGSGPVFWHFLHDYQRQRVLTFLNPERDPLGSGYHIIQSKIAIGSGGIFGKGWFQGSQSHLHFLPEHATDFIFAVCGEEFGLIGCTLLLMLYLAIVGRALYIATQAQDTFSRLLASALGLSFFFSAFVNIGMVTGILPVVGLPLPLVSYGGTSMVTIMAGFGILMAIHSRRRLLGR